MLKNSDTQCNADQIQGTSRQMGQNGFSCPSGTLPYSLLIPWEEGCLGVGLLQALSPPSF